MHYCPHCGETLEQDAESCRHCGSDFETGWNPDTDYYSLELPEDDGAPSREEPRRPSRELSLENLAGPLMIIASGLLFFWAVKKFQDGTAAVASGALLGACIWLYYRRLARGLKVKG